MFNLHKTPVEFFIKDFCIKNINCVSLGQQTFICEQCLHSHLLPFNSAVNEIQRQSNPAEVDRYA